MKPARLGEAGGCRERQRQGFWLAELDGGQKSVEHPGENAR